jgi:hypothetical protein
MRNDEAEAVRYDATTKVLRLDGGGVTYAFGVHDANELQLVYWGRGIGLQDKLAPAEKKPEAAPFAFLYSSTMGYPYPRVFLRGLDARANYKVTPIAGALSKDTPMVASGAYWMDHGVDIELRGDLQAAAFRFDAQ